MVPTRIYCIDDDEAELFLVAQWLDDDPRFEIVGSAIEPTSALHGVNATQPDVIVTDTLSGAGDPTYIYALRVAALHARIVVLSGYEPWQLTPEFARLADRCLTKGAGHAKLVRALEDA
jgi:DNA-binding NarL/FixJ family response regulator